MKRILVFLLLVLFIVIPLSAESLLISLLGVGLDAMDKHKSVTVEMDEEQVYFAGSTLKSLKRSFDDHDFLQLPFDERSQLYEEAKVPIAWPVLKNFLVGGGTGSKLQGSIGGEVFGQIADWTAATAIGIGLGTYLIDLFFIQIFTGGPSRSSYEDPLYDLAIGCMKVGAVFLVAERAIQAILPIPYGLRYNKTLRKGLGINKDGSDMLTLGVDVSPALVMNEDQELGIQVVGRVSIAL